MPRGTVKAHVRNLYAKLGTHRRPGAIAPVPTACWPPRRQRAKPRLLADRIIDSIACNRRRGNPKGYCHAA